MDKGQEDIYEELDEYNKVIFEYKENIRKSIKLLKRFKDKFGK